MSTRLAIAVFAAICLLAAGPAIAQMHSNFATRGAVTVGPRAPVGPSVNPSAGRGLSVKPAQTTSKPVARYHLENAWPK
jgi:hypothetical protein